MHKKINYLLPYLEENNSQLAFIQETCLKQTDGTIITSIKEFSYNILALRQNRSIDIGCGVAVIYKTSQPDII